MSYESPIEINYGEMQTEYENSILKAVWKYDIHCDKEELLKALAYDRKQYEKGYKDRDLEIIRCKECKHYREYTGAVDGCGRCHMAEWYKRYQYPDDFCSRAERREA